jgi:two-component system, OmpR family, response regulator RegX3
VRVLVVEDDDSIAEPLVAGLVREGFDAARVSTGREAVEQAEGAEVVLLDLNLPDADGLDVCRDIRKSSGVPIICVTARSDEAHRVTGLEAGADDYIVKPFGFRELVARIGAVTRRRPQVEARVVSEVGDLVVDRRARRASVAGVVVDLTPKEFDILAVLASDPGATIGRQQLLERVWGAPWYGPTKTLDVHVASLRKKLGDPAWIEAVRGVGFRLAPPP